MNRWRSDPRFRKYARLETVLLVVAIGLAIFAYRGMGPRQDASDDRGSMERRLAAARSDLADLQSGVAADDLRRELDRLESTPLPEFPPLVDALEFGSAVTEYAAAQLLDVLAFDVASAAYDTGGASHPAISYALDARGPMEVLVGVLSIPSRFPTSVVQELELTRPEGEESGEDWLLRLTVVVVHSGA
jgi:hypothetical protein